MSRDKFVWKEGDIEIVDTADMRMHKEKWSFLHTQILGSCRLASLQRANVYEKTATEDERRDFQKQLDLALTEIGGRYGTDLGEPEHVRNIEELAARLSKGCGPALVNGRLRLGVAQKALNLYLKYLWCFRKIPMPPHCPLDSRIILQLPSVREVSWTKMTEVSAYRKVIAAAKEVAGSKPLAEWELVAYQEASSGA